MLSSINRKIWGERGGRVCFSKPSVYLPAILVRGNRRLFRNFSAYFPETEQVFVQAFLDMVSEYAQKESADLNRFLRWWDETGYRKTIATPDGQNAIRILTVHKSKA